MLKSEQICPFILKIVVGSARILHLVMVSESLGRHPLFLPLVLIRDNIL